MELCELLLGLELDQQALARSSLHRAEVIRPAQFDSLGVELQGSLEVVLEVVQSAEDETGVSGDGEGKGVRGHLLQSAEGVTEVVLNYRPDSLLILNTSRTKNFSYSIIKWCFETHPERLGRMSDAGNDSK